VVVKQRSARIPFLVLVSRRSWFLFRRRGNSVSAAQQVTAESRRTRALRRGPAIPFTLEELNMHHFAPSSPETLAAFRETIDRECCAAEARGLQIFDLIDVLAQKLTTLKAADVGRRIQAATAPAPQPAPRPKMTIAELVRLVRGDH
jgi:hypothetical protein